MEFFFRFPRRIECVCVCVVCNGHPVICAYESDCITTSIHVLLLLLLLSSFVFIITICIEYLARCTLFAAAITGIRNEYENSEKKINK